MRLTLCNVRCVKCNGRAEGRLLGPLHITQFTLHKLRSPIVSTHGVTLIELLMAVIISAIAFFPLAMPFIGERSFWGTGERQTEAQRDAQMVLRTMARAARECHAYSTGTGGFLPGATLLSFDSCANDPIYPAGSRCFAGGPAYLGGTMIFRSTNCQTIPSTIVLIDGTRRSQVVNFTVTPIVPNKLVRVHLEVSHRRTTTDTRVRNEILETEIFLRNAT